MHIALHCGVHGTDHGLMIQTLGKNTDALRAKRTEVVLPKSHRGLFNNAMQSLSGGAATDEMEQVLLDAMLESEEPQRAILSTPGLLGTPNSITGRNGLYPSMAARLSSLVNLFPNCTTEIFLAMRNPATMLSSIFYEISPGDRNGFLNACQYYQLRWNEPIRRLTQSLRGRRIVIWCDEDAPVIWPELTGKLADMPDDTPMHGTLDYLRKLLSPEGIVRLDARTARDAQISRSERIALGLELLQNHAAKDAIEQEIALPGWSQEMVDEVTELYYRDIQEIASLPNIEFVSPQTV